MKAKNNTEDPLSVGKAVWNIEYEIPPLRAIYMAEADDCTEAELLMAIQNEQPLWKIRKLKRLNQ